MLMINDWYNGPYPSRVRIAVAELRLASKISFTSVDLWKGEHKGADFLLKNYSGTLPVLQIEDGTYFAECTAITAYLDALGDAPQLTGATPLEKGMIHIDTLAEVGNFFFVSSAIGLRASEWLALSNPVSRRDVTRISSC